MSIIAHIKSLYKKHHELEEQIRQAYLYHRDPTELKKTKLQLKDEINSYESMSKAANNNQMKDAA